MLVSRLAKVGHTLLQHSLLHKELPMPAIHQVCNMPHE